MMIHHDPIDPIPRPKMDTPRGLFAGACSCGWESMGLESENGAKKSAQQHADAKNLSERVKYMKTHSDQRKQLQALVEDGTLGSPVPITELTTRDAATLAALFEKARQEMRHTPVGEAIRVGAFPVIRNGAIEAAGNPFRAAYFLSDDAGRVMLANLYPDLGRTVQTEEKEWPQRDTGDPEEQLERRHRRFFNDQ